MKILEPNIDSILNIKNDKEFESLAIDVFNFQYQKNGVYRQFVDLLKVEVSQVNELSKIPFLPISFFKTHKVITQQKHEIVFKSSGTSGQLRSQHLLSDVSIYQKAFVIKH